MAQLMLTAAADDQYGASEWKDGQDGCLVWPRWHVHAREHTCWTGPTGPQHGTLAVLWAEPSTVSAV